MCVNEFAGRLNTRGLDPIDMTGAMASGIVGKRLTYAHLITPGSITGIEVGI